MKKTIAAGLAAAFLLMSAGCSSGGKIAGDLRRYEEGMHYTTSAQREAAAVRSVYYEFLGGKDVMPIGGFYGPYASGGSVNGNASPNYLTDEIFGAIADAGINNIVYSIDRWTTGGANGVLKDSFALGEKYGIGFYVGAFDVYGQLGTHTEDVPIDRVNFDFLADLVNEITDGGKNKCVLGLHAQDEPFTKQLDNLTALYEAFYALDHTAGLDVCVNALNGWEGTNNLYGTDEDITYEEYMRRYFAGEQKPKFLSITQYPYTGAKTSEADMAGILYSNLALYRKYAQDYKVPFWRMVQAGGQWNDEMLWKDSVDPYPSEGELLYDVNLSLAYGAKSVQYFPLIQPEHFAWQTGGTYDYENRNGLIGANGNLTRWYYYAQRANRQIQAIDHVLMNAESEKIIVHGPAAGKYFLGAAHKEDVTDEDNYYELRSVKGDDCIVGCFNYGGKTALYAVNYSRTKKAEVSLAFDRDDYLFELVQRAQSVKAVGGTVNLRLDAGEGALIVLN